MMDRRGRSPPSWRRTALLYDDSHMFGACTDYCGGRLAGTVRVGLHTGTRGGHRRVEGAGRAGGRIDRRVPPQTGSSGARDCNSFLRHFSACARQVSFSACARLWLLWFKKYK